jgi:hypothetical protein
VTQGTDIHRLSTHTHAYDGLALHVAKVLLLSCVCRPPPSQAPTWHPLDVLHLRCHHLHSLPSPNPVNCKDADVLPT